MRATFRIILFPRPNKAGLYTIKLRTSNVRDLRVEYIRKKTHKAYSIRLHPKAGAIIDRYRGGSHLFPVYADGVHDTEAQKFSRLHKIMKQVNKALREVAVRVGLNAEGLTFYVSRHSYGMALKTKGVSRDIISEALGHSDVRTTDHYLKDFEAERLDRADEGIF